MFFQETIKKRRPVGIFRRSQGVSDKRILGGTRFEQMFEFTLPVEAFDTVDVWFDIRNIIFFRTREQSLKSLMLLRCRFLEDA